MRIVLLLLTAAVLVGCMPTRPPVQFSALPQLPYAACGDMTGLRSNLTGAPDPSRWSDAELRSLGVRCLGDPIGQAPVRPRY